MRGLCVRLETPRISAAMRRNLLPSPTSPASLSLHSRLLLLLLLLLSTAGSTTLVTAQWGRGVVGHPGMWGQRWRHHFKAIIWRWMRVLMVALDGLEVEIEINVKGVVHT
jgi:hypothetical protein